MVFLPPVHCWVIQQILGLYYHIFVPISQASKIFLKLPPHSDHLSTSNWSVYSVANRYDIQLVTQVITTFLMVIGTIWFLMVIGTRAYRLKTNGSMFHQHSYSTCFPSHWLALKIATTAISEVPYEGRVAMKFSLHVLQNDASLPHL